MAGKRKPEQYLQPEKCAAFQQRTVLSAAYDNMVDQLDSAVLKRGDKAACSNDIVSGCNGESVWMVMCKDHDVA